MGRGDDKLQPFDWTNRITTNQNCESRYSLLIIFILIHCAERKVSIPSYIERFFWSIIMTSFQKWVTNFLELYQTVKQQNVKAQEILKNCDAMIFFNHFNSDRMMSLVNERLVCDCKNYSKYITIFEICLLFFPLENTIPLFCSALSCSSCFTHMFSP